MLFHNVIRAKQVRLKAAHVERPELWLETLALYTLRRLGKPA